MSREKYEKNHFIHGRNLRMTFALTLHDNVVTRREDKQRSFSHTANSFFF